MTDYSPALTRAEAMEYLGIKSPVTFQQWCTATECHGIRKNPGKSRSPRLWRRQELDAAWERARCTAPNVGHTPAPTPQQMETPADLLDRLFPRTKQTRRIKDQ